MLSAIVGVERQRKLKSAGLRTHTLVGLGSALFTLVSAYGFAGVVTDGVVLDPSRIAAQVVSGIGFLGAGVIFVRRNVVNGLTTAASIWVTAAIGMACGAGMPIVAIAATGLHLITVGVLTLLGRSLRPSPPSTLLLVYYRSGGGILRRVLLAAGESGYPTNVVTRGATADELDRRVGSGKDSREVAIRMGAERGKLAKVISAISAIPGVVNVVVADDDDD